MPVLITCPVCTGSRQAPGGACGACGVTGWVTPQRAEEITAQRAAAAQRQADADAALADRAARVQAAAITERQQLAAAAAERQQAAAAAAAAERARAAPLEAAAAAAADAGIAAARIAAGILEDPPAEQYGPAVHSQLRGFPNGTTGWLNVITYGADPFGIYDSTAAIQAALSQTGVIYLPTGVYLISQTLQMASGTFLTGDGEGLTVIRAKNGFFPAQVGNNTGAPMICTKGNTAQSHLTVANLTLDGNQASISSIPGYADGPECSPLALWNSTVITIDGIEVINPVGYALYLQNCTYFVIHENQVTAGAGSALGTNQQDGIHLTGCAHGQVVGNVIDTGTGTAGDDGIALQALGTACTDISIISNTIRGAQSGIHLAIGGTANIQDVSISGNVIWQATGGDGLRIDTTGTGAAVAVDFTGNSMRNLPQHAINITAPFTGITITGNEIDDITNGLAIAVFIAAAGAALAVTGNTFSNCLTATGIAVGATGGGATVTRWAVTDNVLDMSSGASAVTGILVTDAPDGMCSNNAVFGSTQAGSAGIKINGVSVAPAGLAVNGNRVKGWATGILEVNSGASPNFNAVVGNNAHGCTAFITTVGGSDVVASNVVA